MAYLLPLLCDHIWRSSTLKILFSMSKVFQMNPFYVVNFKNLMSTFVTHFPRCLTWKSQCGEKRCLFCSLHISMSPKNIKENAENVQFNLISGRVQFVQMVAHRLVPDKLPSSLSWGKEGNIVTYNDYCYGESRKSFFFNSLHTAALLRSRLCNCPTTKTDLSCLVARLLDSWGKLWNLI